MRYLREGTNKDLSQLAQQNVHRTTFHICNALTNTCYRDDGPASSVGSSRHHRLAFVRARESISHTSRHMNGSKLSSCSTWHQRTQILHQCSRKRHKICSNEICNQVFLCPHICHPHSSPSQSWNICIVAACWGHISPGASWWLLPTV